MGNWGYLFILFPQAVAGFPYWELPLDPNARMQTDFCRLILLIQFSVIQ